MPYYIFENNGEFKEIFQNMNDKHEYIENGIKWTRIFNKPQAVISSASNLDPGDSKSFVNVTGQKKGTLGDLLDLSKECSEKRESKYGVDKTKETYYKNYEKLRGKKHLNEKKEKLKGIVKDAVAKLNKK